MTGQSINIVIMAMCIATLIWSFIVFLSGTQGVPRLALLVYLVLSIFGIWGSRQVSGWLLRSTGAELPKAEFTRTPIIIYGAGQPALGLARALERSDRYVAVGLVDRNASLWGQYVGGYKVFRPLRLRALIDRRGVKEILIALDSTTSRAERASIIREVEGLGVAMRKLPAIEDLASGRITTTDLRPIEASDLLGRDPVPANAPLMRKSVSGKVVLVTGAGGSIGSELCRQLLQLSPQRLILLDASETALVEVHHQLRDRIQAMTAAGPATDEATIEIVPVLGSVGNEALVRDLLRRFEVDAIYHAAAHKHVPVLENNVVQGIENNTFGTLTLAKAALAEGVARFVLVSTDKAVRPTNVMGASKRLAEIILQSMAAQGAKPTVFTMVRFGNVLDSSGSVVPLFRKQIAAGGPVTVTHPEMIRYFMSIPEAASLVIQAGAMARGGEVFVLDMGEPVKIDTLARSMIQLAGLKVREPSQPDGDIAIEYVGLRPGEKLREELLIGNDTHGTDHPRIQTSNEPFLDQQRLEAELADLQAAMKQGEIAAIHEILRRTVEGYRSGSDAAQTNLADADSLGYGWTVAPSKALH
jgi:FlaA1/EpsC-like NDP-sugar epimerase